MFRLAISVMLAACATATVGAAGDSAWHPASVDIGGRHILVFRVGAGGLTAAERRAVLEFRLTEALTRTSYLRPVLISLHRVPGGVAIAANGYHFVTATADDARANDSALWTLAREWGDSIKRTFEAVGPARQVRLDTGTPWRAVGRQ